MFAHDDEYLTGMATVVLAALMIVAMFWIRSHMPDDVVDAGQSSEIVAGMVQPATLQAAMNTDVAGIRQPR